MCIRLRETVINRYTYRNINTSNGYILLSCMTRWSRSRSPNYTYKITCAHFITRVIHAVHCSWCWISTYWLRTMYIIDVNDHWSDPFGSLPFVGCALRNRSSVVGTSILKICSTFSPNHLCTDRHRHRQGMVLFVSPIGCLARSSTRGIYMCSHKKQEACLCIPAWEYRSQVTIHAVHASPRLIHSCSMLWPISREFWLLDNNTSVFDNLVMYVLGRG